MALVTPTASALPQARQRLGVAPVRALFDLLRGVVKRAIFTYNARGPNIDRTSYQATIEINILAAGP